MKRKIKNIFFGIVGLTLLAACSSKEETGSEQSPNTTDSETTLTIWAWDTNFNIPIMEKAGEYYINDDHESVTINVVEMFKRRYQTKNSLSLHFRRF